MLSAIFKILLSCTDTTIGTYKLPIILLLTTSDFTVHNWTPALQALKIVCVLRILFFAPRTKLLSILVQQPFVMNWRNLRTFED